MKSLVTFILGILGLASLVGAGFVAYKGGGLANLMQEHDSALQEMDDGPRAELLDSWVADMQAEAEALTGDERRATMGPSIKDVQNEIVSTLNKADHKINVLSNAWHEDEAKTKEADVALQETESDLAKAEAAYDSLSDEEKVELRKNALSVGKAVDAKYRDDQLEDQPEMKKRVDNIHNIVESIGKKD